MVVQNDVAVNKKNRFLHTAQQLHPIRYPLDFQLVISYYRNSFDFRNINNIRVCHEYTEQT